jgi:antitoxin YefM
MCCQGFAHELNNFSARGVDNLIPVQYAVQVMKSFTYTEVRAKLSETIKRVCDDHDPVTITKRRDKAVVMMSLEDYESLLETCYLLKSPRNARRILESIKEIEEGKGRKRKLRE